MTDGIGRGADAPPAEDSKAARVYSTLRQRIRSLELPPGTRLDKADIAGELGVSRAPVSEAIARLADEMLVDVFPRHGSFVAPIRDSDLRECMFIRRALEIEAARRVALLDHDGLVRALEANLRDQQRALDADDLLHLYTLDQRFHDILLGALEYPRAAQLRSSVGVPLDRPRQFALPAQERAAATLVEHRRILDGIAVGDADYAGAAMRVHLAMSERAMEFGLSRLEGSLSDPGEQPQRGGEQ